MSTVSSTATFAPGGDRAALAVLPLSPAIERTLFWSLLALTILPVWTTTYFPSQDGPVHLYIVHLLQLFMAGADGIVHQYFELNPHFEPNLAFYGFALLLGQVFDLLVVEKLFLSGLALALCLAVRVAVRSLNPAASVYSLLAVPTAFHYFVHMGFYNYSLGIAATILALTICRPRLDQPSMRDLGVIGLVSLAVLLVHLMAFLVLLVCLALIVAWRSLADWRAGLGPRDAVAALLARGIGLGLALLPALALAAAFFLRHGLNQSRADEVGPNSLIGLVTLVSFDDVELWLMAPWIALFYVLCGYTLVRHLRAGTLGQAALFALLPAALVLVYLGNPVTAAGLRVGERFIPFIICLTFLWFATATPGRGMTWAVVAVASTTTVANAGLRVAQYDRHDQHMQGYMAAAESIEPGHTLLPLHLEPTPDLAGTWFRRPDPLLHLAAHMAIERDLIYLRASLMSTHAFGYFPIIYRQAVDPFLHIENGLRLDGELLDVRIADYPSLTGASLDYVLLWPAPAEMMDDAISVAIRAQVAEDWRAVPVPADASGELFRRENDVYATTTRELQ